MDQADDHRIIALLAGKGLRAIEAQQTVEQLRQRYGAARWFDFLDVIYLPPAALFEGLTQPWFIYNEPTCLLPPTLFDCDFDGGQDGPGNHKIALDGLERELGAPVEEQRYNALKHVWRFGRLELSLLTFIQSKTRTNSLYERNPQLWNYCRVAIEHHWLRTLSEEEASRLGAISEADLMRLPASWADARSSLSLWERGILRTGAFPAAGDIVFWRSGKGDEFGWYTKERAAIFQRTWSPRLSMGCNLGERGAPDCATVDLHFTNPFSRDGQTVRMHLLTREGSARLDAEGERLARFWGLNAHSEPDA